MKEKVNVVYNYHSAGNSKKKLPAQRVLTYWRVPFVQIDGGVMWMDTYVLQSRFSPNSYPGHL